KPRDRPVSRSMTTCAEVTVPYWPNASVRSLSVVLKAMLPTYSFLLTNVLSEPRVWLRQKESGLAAVPNGPESAANWETTVPSTVAAGRSWAARADNSEQGVQEGPRHERCVCRLPPGRNRSTRVRAIIRTFRRKAPPKSLFFPRYPPLPRRTTVTK